MELDLSGWVGGERGGRWKKTVWFFLVFFKEGLTRHVNLWIINENHFTLLSTAIQTSEQFIQSTAFQTIKKMKRKTQHAVNTCIKLFKIRNARQRMFSKAELIVRPCGFEVGNQRRRLKLINTRLENHKRKISEWKKK